MQYRAPRGTRDILPADIPIWQRLEGTARELARLFGAQEIRTPFFEQTELFVRSVGEVTDIVEKEMFTIQKGSNSVTLRPEGTAGIVRAYLQAGLAKQAPVQKFFHVGPMFRYERPQKGRERQFTQFDFESLGSHDPRLDAETIHIAASFFDRLGVPDLQVRLNSMGDGDDRDRWRDAVRAFLAPLMEQHCELCQSRFERNVMRVLDCKNPSCQALHEGAPILVDFLSPENRQHFEDVTKYLKELGRTVIVDPGIVRGLDYYTHTVFEVHNASLGRALCGGGRYNHLVRDLGGPDLPAVGFAIGFEPTLVVLEQLGLLGEEKPASADVYVVATENDNAELTAEVFRVAQELRAASLSVVYDVEARSLKAQMKRANAGGHRLAIIVGPDEVERGQVQIKDLQQSEQHEIARSDMGSFASGLLASTKAASNQAANN